MATTFEDQLREMDRLMGESMVDKVDDYTEAFSSMLDNQRDLLLEFYRKSSDDERDSIRSTMQDNQSVMQEQLDQMKRSYNVYKKHMTHSEKKLFKTLYKETQYGMKNIEKEMKNRFGDMEDDFEGLSESFSVKFQNFAETVRDTITSINVDNIAHNVSERSKSRNRMYRQAESRSDREYRVNDVWDPYSNLRNAGKDVARSAGWSIDADEGLEKLVDMMTSYRIHDENLASQYMGTLASLEKVAGISPDSLDNIVWKDMRYGKGGSLLKQFSNVASFLDSNSDLNTSMETILSSINENIGSIKDISGKDSKKTTKMVGSLATLEALQETVANEGTTTVTDFLKEFMVMTAPEALEDDRAQRFAQMAGMSVTDALKLAQGSTEDMSKLILSIQNGFKNFNGNDFMFNAVKGDMGFDSVADMKGFAETDIKDVLKKIQPTVKSAEAYQGNKAAEQAEKTESGFDMLVNQFKALGDGLGDTFTNLFGGIFGSEKIDISLLNAANWVTVANSGKDIVKDIFGWFKGGGFGRTKDRVKGAVGKVKGGVTKAKDWVKGKFGKGGNNVDNAVNSLDDIYDAASDVRGASHGVSEATESVAERSVREATESAAERGVREAAESAVENSAENVTRSVAERSVREAAGSVAERSVREVTGSVAERGVQEIAENGAKKFGTKFLAKGAGKAVPIIGAAIDIGMDAAGGADKAKEWFGDKAGTQETVSSAIGGALGGTGSGVFDKNTSSVEKAVDVGAGALKGAGVGAAIGSIIPGIGTAIGGAVGGAIGAIGSAIGGENIAKAVDGAVGFGKDVVKSISNFGHDVISNVSNKLTGKQELPTGSKLKVSFDNVDNAADPMVQRLDMIISYLDAFSKAWPAKSEEQVLEEQKKAEEEKKKQVEGFSFTDIFSGGGTFLFKSVKSLFGFDNGLSEVSEDGAAYIHKGEAILTKDQANVLRDKADGGIDIPDSDAKASAFLYNKIKDIPNAIREGFRNIQIPSMEQLCSSVDNMVGEQEKARKDDLESRESIKKSMSSSGSSNFTTAQKEAASALISAVPGAAALFPHITAFKSGGLVTKPTLGLVGEAGPEAVVPTSNLQDSSVDPNVKPLESLSDKKLNFINKVKPGAIKGYKKYGVLPSLTLAQAALESGWGDHAIGNNYFGIKAGKNWKGKTRTVWTTEQKKNGQKYKIQAAFRDYDSIDDSIVDHAKLLSGSRYKAVIAAKDYKEAAKAVKAAGYATSLDYAQSLIGLIESNGLNKWDPKASYAVGTPFVPEDQVALIHEGEMIVPAASNPLNTTTTSVPVQQGSSDDSQTVETLKWVVSRLESKLDRIIALQSQRKPRLSDRSAIDEIYSRG